jgi:hypothetical protein
LVNVANQGRKFAMIPKRATPKAIEDQSTVKANYASSARRVLGGIVWIVALCAFIAFLAAGLYGGKWEAALLVSILASLALRAIVPGREAPHAIEGEGTVTARQSGLPDWYLVSYCVVCGLGVDWSCAFLWFFRRYAFFSGPVLGVTGLIVALCATIGFLVARMMKRDWRTALAVFALASWIVDGVALRWGPLR